MNSKLLDFIKKNPEDWETKINEMKINTYWDDRFPGLCIFKYQIDADFTNPICREARGIIIDTINLKIVCRPFDKFFAYNNPKAAEIDWNSATVFEKIDGTMISVWYYNAKDEKDSKWVISTQRFISADDPNCIVSDRSMTFHELFLKAIHYKSSIFDYLNPDYTYVFELVSPHNQVVIKYDKPAVCYLTTRNNETGKEIDQTKDNNKLNNLLLYKFYQPEKYALSNLDDCIEFLKKMNKNKDNIIDHVDFEGFVVVDKDFNRIKIKTIEWLILHHAFNNGVFSTDKIIPLLIEYDIDIESVIKDNPMYEVFLRYVQFKLAEIKSNLNKVIITAKRLYELYNKDLKLLGSVFSKSKYKPYIFYAIKNSVFDIDILIKEINIRYLIDLIGKYEIGTPDRELYEYLNKQLARTKEKI